MRLSMLIDDYKGRLDPEIAGISHDSRQVRPRYLFAALPGGKMDGRSFIKDALYNGAAAILAPAGTILPDDTAPEIALVAHNQPRRALALAAARFYGAQPAFIAAVTGTNGKTSVADFARQLWMMRGIKAASIGTLGVRGGAAAQGGSMTTPDPVSLHAALADMAAAGINHLALEASSHGLDQCRLDGVKIMAAGFTNLSRDHLDYHKDMDHYLAAKAHLFNELLLDDGVAVLNADIPEYEILRAGAQKRGVRICSYGIKGQDICLEYREAQPDGQALSIKVAGRAYNIVLPLVGEFQAMNALCALGLVLAEPGVDQDNIVPRLADLKGVPGRLQLVPGHPAGAVYVDYAHTPDALENILKALRPHTPGRLICLIGCGGDRDPGKRPLMGKIAAAQADMAVITDDNPRGEDPAAIRHAMMAGIDDHARAHEVGGRREAIGWAMAQMQPGDVLAVAGKGHEQGQIIGDTVLPFDDVAEVQAAINELRA